MYLIERTDERMPKGRVASVAIVATGIALGALAVVPNVIGVLFSYAHSSRTLGAACMTVLVSFVLGVSAALLVAPSQTIVQQRADANPGSRMFAVQQALQAAVAIPPIIAVAAGARCSRHQERWACRQPSSYSPGSPVRARRADHRVSRECRAMSPPRKRDIGASLTERRPYEWQGAAATAELPGASSIIATHHTVWICRLSAKK